MNAVATIPEVITFTVPASPSDIEGFGESKVTKITDNLLEFRKAIPVSEEVDTPAAKE